MDKITAKRQEELQKIQNLIKEGELVTWSADTVVSDAMNQINFDIAGKKLGRWGPSVVKALQVRRRDALPELIDDAISNNSQAGLTPKAKDEAGSAKEAASLDLSVTSALVEVAKSLGPQGLKVVMTRAWCLDELRSRDGKGRS